jgi:energy-coupling factor transporter ATP-binding protein EcfA2
MSQELICPTGALPIDLDRIKRAFNTACRVALVVLPLLLCSCVPCSECEGKGTNWGFKCKTCDGTGKILTTELLVAGGVALVILTVGAFTCFALLASLANRFFKKRTNLRPSPTRLALDGRADESRHVFIIGPEGAGKTTFLAALSRLAIAHPEKLVFEPSDHESSQYVAKALERLERGEWPISNPQENLEICRWKIGRPRKALHEVTLFDYSGQDMRAVLKDNDTGLLQGRPGELRHIVDGADLLIYLFDFDGLIGSGSLSDINDNFWLLRTFLTRPGWTEKHRILVATKADLYSELIAASGGDLREAIVRQLTNVPGSSGLGRHLAGVKCFMVSSALTRTTLDEKSEPSRKPRTPLQSEGFEPLIKEILSVLNKG